MLMNWPERVWIYSPLRVFFQKREVRNWLRLALPEPNSRALEIGCGLGKGAQLAVDLMGFAHVSAFDLEAKLVRWADRRLPSRYQHRIAFYVGDAQDLPFEGEHFDCVLNFGIIHHVLDWRRAISEVARVLRPAGLFYFEEIYPPLYAGALLKRMLRHPRVDRFHAPEFLACLSDNGLDLVQGVNTTSPYGIVGAARKRS